MTTDRARPGAKHPARVVSLVVALAVTVTLFAFPFALGGTLTPSVHAWITVLLIGLCGAWVHGLGYVPERRALAVLAGPAFAWPAIALAAVMLVAAAADH